MKYLILMLSVVMGHASDVVEYDVGAKWDIEYRVQNNPTTKATSVLFVNRRNRDVRLTFSVQPGFAEKGDNASGAIIIESKGRAVYNVVSPGIIRPSVELNSYTEGSILSRGETAYDMNGVQISGPIKKFIADEDMKTDSYVGIDIHEALKSMGISYDNSWINSHTESLTIYDGGNTSSSSGQQVRVLTIPARQEVQGKPIWKYRIHLNGDTISQISKVFEYYR